MKKIYKSFFIALAIIVFAVTLAKASDWHFINLFGHRHYGSLLLSANDNVQTDDWQNTEQLWGVYAGNDILSLKNFQEKVGASPDMVSLFLNYSDPFPSEQASYIKSNNQILALYWEQYGITLDQIISGGADDNIRQLANDISLYGGPVILLPLHEMNGNWDSWGGTVGNNDAQKVVLAFRHIRDVFSKTPVSNVKWAWDINNVSVPDTEENAIANYYPGDDYVDYVGVDGFNFGDPWQSYSEVFLPASGQLKSYNKPIYIFSVACAQGKEKAGWITDAISRIKADTAIKGWIWFNEDKENNWQVWSDQDSLKAFKAGIK